MKKQILFCSMLIWMIASAIVNAQVTTPANTGSSGDYVGWAGSEAFDLNVKHNGAYHINFHTNGTQRMTILGSTNPGFVGIGNGFSPAYKLDVDAGDINL